MMKYQEWLGEWLEYYVKPTTKERTYNKYSKITRNHIISKLGDKEISDISAMDFQKFTVDLINKGMAPNTVNGIISVIKNSLKRAEALGIVVNHYAGKIIRPKVKEKEIECLSRDEQYKVEKYIADGKVNNRIGIIICLYTGLRVGELLALKWNDIDFNKGLISINKSCHDSWKCGSYVKVIDTPKTISSVRIIPVPKQLLSRLKQAKKQYGGEYVVMGKTCHGAQVRSYQRTFNDILKKLNIPHKGIHSLRHTFATRALEVGMDVKTLSEILGHKSPTVTLNRYVHSMIEYKAQMMNKVGKNLI